MAAKKKEDDKDKDKSSNGDDSNKKELENLKKTLGELSQTVEAQNEFINASTTVINTLAYTPELREAFRKQYAKQTGTEYKPLDEGGDNQEDKKGDEKDKNKPDDGKSANLERTVNDVARSRRAEILKDFEDETGISALKEEEQKTARNEISDFFNDFGWRADKIPLEVLRKNLDKAYMGTLGLNKLREEGKLEGIAAFRQNQQATMGNVSGGAPETGEGEKDLTPVQKEWAKKLKVDPEKAKKTYLTRDEEQTRVAKAEEKKDKKK